MDNEKNKKDSKEKNLDYEEKIRKLEKRVEELEIKEDEEETGTVESVIGQLIPGLGGIVRALEKSSPEFRKRIAETDAEIAHRIETGWNSKPKVDYGISIRPLTGQKGIKQNIVTKKPDEVKIETEIGEPTIDVFEEKDYLSVIADLPGVDEKDIETKLEGDTLEICAGNYRKTIKLPSVSSSIIDKTFNNGILQLKIEWKNNAS